MRRTNRRKLYVNFLMCLGRTPNSPIVQGSCVTTVCIHFEGYYFFLKVFFSFQQNGSGFGSIVLYFMLAEFYINQFHPPGLLTINMGMVAIFHSTLLVRSLNSRDKTPSCLTLL